MTKKVESRVNYHVQDTELMLTKAQHLKLINDSHGVEGIITWIEQVPVRIAMSEEKPNLPEAPMGWLSFFKARRSSS